MDNDELILTTEATPSLLSQLHAQGQITDHAYQRGLAMLGASVEDRWRWLLNAAFLGIGLALLTAGLSFLVIKFWSVFDNTARFGLVGLLIAGSALLAYKKGFDTPVGTAMLGFATLMIGAQLLLIGYTYKSGTPWYALYGTWAGLALCWVAISRSPGMWLFWLALLNLFVGSFVTETLQTGLLKDLMPLSIAFLNVLCLALWELASPRFSWLQMPRDVARRAIGLTAIFFFSTSVCISQSHIIQAIAVVSILLFFGWYRFRRYNHQLAIGSYLSIPFFTLVLCYRYISGGMEATLIASMLIGVELYGALYLLKGAGNHVYETS